MKADELIKPDLTLTIKKVWLEKIVSGEKKEEYRDAKEYYHRMFKELNEGAEVVKPVIKTLKLRAGYRKDSPFAIVEVDKIRYEQFFGETKPIPDGFEKEDIAYVIYIKSVIYHNLQL